MEAVTKMAKKRVQVGEFQKRAQLQSAARLVDQYVTPTRTNRQAQIASALEQAIPALQEFQKTKLEQDLNEVESKVIKEINSGNMKTLLTDYENFSADHKLVRNTYAKKRYEETLAPLAARQVGSELAKRYQESNYAQSTDPADYQAFLNENLDDITDKYAGAFSESTGGVEAFQRSINPYINQFQQRFTETSIANNKAEETDKLTYLLSQVSTPEEARKFYSEARSIGILSDLEIERIIFSQMENELEGVNAMPTNKTFKAFENLKVGKTGQNFGKKYTEGTGFNGKRLKEFTDQEVAFNQTVYKINKREKEQQAYLSIVKQIEDTNYESIINAYSPTDNPKVSENNIKNMKESLKIQMQNEGVPENIISQTFNNMDVKFSTEIARIETSPTSRLSYIQKYNSIIQDDNIEDKQAALNSYMQNQQESMTVQGFNLLSSTFTDLANSKGIERATPVINAMINRIKMVRGQESVIVDKDSLYIADQKSELLNIVLTAGDDFPTEEEAMFNYLVSKRKGKQSIPSTSNIKGVSTFGEFGSWGSVTSSIESSKMLGSNASSSDGGTPTIKLPDGTPVTMEEL